MLRRSLDQGCRNLLNLLFHVKAYKLQVQRVSSSVLSATILALTAELPTLQQRIVTRLQKLRMTTAQIQHVLDFMGDDEGKIARLMKVSHPLLRDFEAGNKVFDNLGGATINLLKTEFPHFFCLV